jgi:cell wall-associated NlpC family hydrolase/LysM repeat protein
MPMKKLTLGLCLVTSSAALAHNIEYKVCKGDTLETISTKFHVSGKAILHVNDLQPTHHMRAGHFLLIPYVSAKVSRKIAKNSAIATKRAGSITMEPYVVRNGDQDWALAKKNGISLHALHAANPGIDWDHLKLGHTIQLPKIQSRVAQNHPIAHKSKATHVASNGGVHMRAHWHVVEEGENDWIIAHKAGIRLPLLKALNTDIDVSNLRIGQKVRVPGSSAQRLALEVHRIHSSRVAISGDNVTIRREAGVNADSITTVDQGIHASVLDRDGDWYQLKFPKGTVGWVRGDLLKAVHEDEVASVTHHRSHRDDDDDDNDDAPVVHRHKPTYVASKRTHETRHHDVVAVRSHQAPAHEHSASMSYTALDTDAGDAQSVLHVAHQYRGTRYSWGSASRSGTDCSGFALQVYAKNGIHLPRTSREQATVGEPVDRKNLRPGDLVFFHTMRGHRISHVVIYEGNNKFIHASSRGGHVQENSLDESYYSNRFVTARRFLKHKAHGAATVHSSSVVAKESPKADPSPKPEVPETPAPVTAR